MPAPIARRSFLPAVIPRATVPARISGTGTCGSAVAALLRAAKQKPRGASRGAFVPSMRGALLREGLRER